LVSLSLVSPCSLCKVIVPSRLPPKSLLFSQLPFVTEYPFTFSLSNFFPLTCRPSRLGSFVFLPFSTLSGSPYRSQGKVHLLGVSGCCLFLVTVFLLDTLFPILTPVRPSLFKMAFPLPGPGPGDSRFTHPFQHYRL